MGHWPSREATRAVVQGVFFLYIHWLAPFSVSIIARYAISISGTFRMRASLCAFLLLAATLVAAIENIHVKVKHLIPAKRSLSLRTRDAPHVRSTSHFLNEDSQSNSPKLSCATRF
jgi:hypothetical protein